MVEFKIHVHPTQRLAYIPRELHEVLGDQMKATANRAAVLFYPESMSIQDVLKSLDLIRQDLEHGLELQKESEKR